MALPMRERLRHITAVDFRRKIIPFDDLAEWRRRIGDSGTKLVVTNGCFDLLHLGHATYLETARQQGDLLLVGVTGDDAVRSLKGLGRPLNNENDRAALLAALECVDQVCVFNERSASHFLAVARPNVYVKGGDYTVETLNQEERRVVESGGGKIIILPLLAGKSTTGLLGKIAQLA
jgi:rfaE bifunctional protein nucleotidyltransferase chain/domain